MILGFDCVGKDIEKFLRDQGLKNLTETFVSEEIEVRHVNRLNRSKSYGPWGKNDGCQDETSICCDSLGLTTRDLFVSSQQIVMSNSFVYLKPPN